MLRIGLTGGIGSGKSEVRRLLADRGAQIFDADQVAKQLMVSDPDVMADLKEVLGDRAWHADGSLNRSWIAGRLFSDDAIREAVNGIVHPAVYRAFTEAASRAEEEGAKAMVREAALLPPPEQREALDRIVAVTAPQALRIQRVMQRDGSTYAEVESRMAAQPRDTDYAAVADHVISNGGSLEELAAQVDALWSAWIPG